MGVLYNTVVKLDLARLASIVSKSLAFKRYASYGEVQSYGAAACRISRNFMCVCFCLFV